MKVLLVGATGNVGIRLVASLLTHNHTVVAFVRSASKLESMLSTDVYKRLTVVGGNATDTQSIKRAILDNNCNAVINSAGVAAVAPWGKSELPAIFRTVLDAVQQAGSEKGTPLRVWFMGGTGVLCFPGTQTMLSNYIPIFLEHRANFKLLEALPANSVNWSMLCPSNMVPESADIVVPTNSTSPRLIAKATTPPNWKDSWLLQYIPFFGRVIVAGMNASRLQTTLEQNADLIAEDLEMEDSQWVGKRVGVIDPSK
ncbi:NAD(P)-binding protein [Lophiostoma macrostomum CBS 122681]|uniref:NAD(P)-binding protein n=1 Tax=Lophiostoma macrostomum CBS 122681 TaxID=1314788 RepID=A0A6A6SZH1_9PLEO|nr:NAD(P)-binding protein [Lophiostoma macrostomum CBS 122681]